MSADQVSHFILTRSAYVKRDAAFVSRRMQLFDRVCVPSIRAQVNPRFTWIIAVAPDDPRLGRRWNLPCEVRVIPFAPGNDGAAFWRRAIGEIGSEYLLTTRIDDDDAMTCDFTDRLQNSVERTGEVQILEFPVGWWISAAGASQVHRTGNQFASLHCRADSGLTVLCRQHGQLGDVGRVRAVDGSPAWAWILHDSNQSDWRLGAIPTRQPHREVAGFAVDWHRIWPLLAERPNRVAVLNWIALSRGARRYLEIGCRNDGTFNAVTVPERTGVDPVSGGTHRETSDSFFSRRHEPFDLVFIDGLHLREQVLRDVEGALKCLTPRGVIVLHDCLPREEAHQRREIPRGAWCGDVWKAVVDLRCRPDLDVVVIDSDWGLGIVMPRANTQPISRPSRLDWEDFVSHRNRWLRVMSWAAARDFIGY